MAMSVTITEQEQRQGIQRVKFAWVSAADGTASGTTASKFNGLVYECVTDPSATAPTDNYDITITDDDGIDVLHGLGANRDTATTEYLEASDGLGIVHNSTLALAIANAGDSKEGVVWLTLMV